ncbi:MAG: hypothetical protein HC831_15060 [Chloroflexia bacterium]|nr:hypothetical protein [Chloroflexia bacterium]
MENTTETIFTITSDLVNSTIDPRIIKGDLYIVASKENGFIEDVFGNAEENIAVINCMFSKNNKNYKTIFFEKEYNSTLNDLINGYDGFLI